MTARTVLDALAGGFVTSCQPVRGGVFDDPELVARFARAAQQGGSAGLRVEGLADLGAVRAVSDLPLIGLIKDRAGDREVFITPSRDHVPALVAAGADVVAFDATHRDRDVPVPTMLAAIHQEGVLAMADVATLEEGLAAHAAGAELVGTTLSGYVPGSPEMEGPDLALVQALAEQGVRVVAEGRISTPAQAAEAIRLGAFAVTVGTALTRPELATRTFVDAVRAAGS